MNEIPVDKFGRAMAIAFANNIGPRLNEEIIANALMARQELLGNLIDPRRDIDAECHYPTTQDVSPEQYKQLFDRDPIANRLVSCLPKECWQVQPSVYETEDAEVTTPFEEAWDALQPTTGGVSWYKPEAGGSVWEYLERIDVLSRIGHFGVLLMGFDDGRNLQEPVDGAMVTNAARRPADCYLTKAEEENIRLLCANSQCPLNEQEEAVLNQLAKQREFIVNAMQRGKSQTQNYAFTDEHDPASMTGVQGTDKQYSQEFGLRGEAQYGSGLSGTDQQYFGVQFGPSEQPVKQPSGRQLRLLFLRPFDESLVQIVRYEWNINNPRFGMPVMYRITLNDPRELHSGIGLPMATVFVHWSRVLHVNDVYANAGSSEIFSPPVMRPNLNRLLDLQKIYGASAEGYWQAAFTGLSLETHPQLGGDVTIDSSDVKDQLENYMNSLQRYLALTGMSAHTLAPQVSDPTSQIAGHMEAICIQQGIPIRVFKGSERGELASSQDDSSWNDRLKARQLGYITPRIIVPFVDRLISVGVLPEPNYVEPVEPELDELGMPLDGEQYQDLTDEDQQDEDLAPEYDENGEPIYPDDEEDEEDRTPASLTKNAFCATGEGGGVDPSCGSGGSGGVRRVSKFSELKVGEYGRGAFLMPDNSLVDVTADFGGGTNDHVGVFQMAEHPEEFGITKLQASKAVKEMEEGSDDNSATRKMWDKVYNKGLVRVRQHEGQVNVVGLDFNPDKNSPSKIASHIEEGRIPRVDKYAIEADTRGKHPGFYGEASLKDLQTASTWEQLTKMKEVSKGSLVKQFHTNRRATPILNAAGDPVGIKTATGYSVTWPDLDSNTDKDKAQIAATKMQAIAAYVSGNGESVMPLMDFYTKILGLSDEEAKPLVQAAEQQQAEMELQQMDQQQQFGDQFGQPFGQEQPGLDQGAQADLNDQQPEEPFNEGNLS